MNDANDSVVLRQAFAWDCPSCGKKEIHVSAIEAELTDDEKLSLMKMMGDESEGEDWKGEEFEAHPQLVTCPNHVRCPECNTAFEVWTDPESRTPEGFDPHRDLEG